MKKFTVMILGVSMFFILLGGIAKQLQPIFEFDARLTASLRGDEEREKRIGVSKPRIFLRHSNEDVILDRTSEKTANCDFRLRLPSLPPLRNEAELKEFSVERFEFPRPQSDELMKPGAELPRVSAGENIIIVKRPDAENSKN